MGVVPVSKKEGKQKGKKGIGPRMKNGRTNQKCAKCGTGCAYTIIFEVTDQGQCIDHLKY